MCPICIADAWQGLDVEGFWSAHRPHSAVLRISTTQAIFWYVDFTIISHADRCDLQLPVRRGSVKSVNHAMNLQDLAVSGIAVSNLTCIASTASCAACNSAFASASFLFALASSASLRRRESIFGNHCLGEFVKRHHGPHPPAQTHGQILSRMLSVQYDNGQHILSI